jgi:hypothetical protein
MSTRDQIEYIRDYPKQCLSFMIMNKLILGSRSDKECGAQ